MGSPINQLRIQECRDTGIQALKPQASSLKSKVSVLTSQASRLKSGFTLVELIIVVSILGILAAIVLPEVQGHTQRAKEAAAKDNLRILRNAIERYVVEYGVAPGYPSNDSTQLPNYLVLYTHLVTGNKYLPELPENPFNNHSAIDVLPDGTPISEGTEYNSSYGWVYHPATKKIIINQTGTDSEENSFFEY